MSGPHEKGGSRALGYGEGECSGRGPGLLRTGLCRHRRARKIEQQDEHEPSAQRSRAEGGLTSLIMAGEEHCTWVRY